MKKVLLIYTNFSSFVSTDYEILTTHFQTSRYHYKPVKGILKNAMEFIKQFIYVVFNIWKFDAVYIWFADHHSFSPVLLAKLFKKKSYVVIGGFDVARIPRLNYGVFTSKIRGFFAIYSMKNCTQNIVISKYVERKVKWITGLKNSTLIYNCVNIKQDSHAGITKENLIITVGLIDSERTFYLKGIDTFVEVAKILPNYNFMIIGMNRNFQNKIKQTLPTNVEVKGPVKHNELSYFYKKAKIYCQLSRSESFGVSIVEAMSFGCLPIVTNIGGMPEIVVKEEFIVLRDKQCIQKKINALLQNENPLDIRMFEIEQFHFKRRKQKIIELLEHFS